MHYLNNVHNAETENTNGISIETEMHDTIRYGDRQGAGVAKPGRATPPPWRGNGIAGTPLPLMPGLVACDWWVAAHLLCRSGTTPGGLMYSTMASTDSLPAKTAYQMAIDGDQPPSKYILNKNNNKFGSLDTSPPFAPVPIIDISCFVSSSKQDDDQQAELAKLRSALSTWGCFQAVNHGLPESYLDSIRQVIKQFLELPLEQKRTYFREAGSGEGYGNDVTVSESQVQDWCDRLSLRVLPKDQRNLQFWPENPSNFRETIDDFTMNIKSISVVIFKAMAKCLDLEENCFSKQFTEEHDVMKGRFILYPPCPTPDQVFGLKAHSDRSGITLLLQDPGTEGLQVFNDGKWYMVPVLRDALFINLGDQMQIMSNGIFKSPLHRVVTNKEKGRISVAMFTEPDPDKEIGPVDVLVDEKRPRVYKTVKNYAVFNYECFQKGIVALDAVKV